MTYSAELKQMANRIEEIRIAVFNTVGTENSKTEMNEKIFSVQSKVRDVANWLSYYDDYENCTFGD